MKSSSQSKTENYETWFNENGLQKDSRLVLEESEWGFGVVVDSGFIN